MCTKVGRCTIQQKAYLAFEYLHSYVLIAGTIMALTNEMPPGASPPEWEKAKQALAAIQQPKKQQQQQKQQAEETSNNDDNNTYDKYGGPIGYPPGFNMMYPGFPPPGPGFGCV